MAGLWFLNNKNFIIGLIRWFHFMFMTFQICKVRSKVFLKRAAPYLWALKFL